MNLFDNLLGYDHNQSNSSMAAQQQAHYNAVLAQAAQQRQPRPEWVFAGETLTVIQFAQRVYGDSPQATEFILRYQ